MKLNKQELKKLIREALTDHAPLSMILEAPIKEMSTAGSVADRINIPSDQEGFTIGNTGRVVDKFMIISADRGENSAAENKKRYREMKQRVSAAGFPFTELEGGWTETKREANEGTVVGNPGDGQGKVDVVESSVIVYDEPRGPGAPEPEVPLKQLGMTLAADYEQEAFIYGFLTQATDGEVHRIIKGYGPNGKVQDWLNAASLQKVPEDAEYWSRIRRRGPKTQLKEEDVVEIEAPNSVIEAMRKASQHKGKKIKFIRRKD
jgi:hypothetical protein